MGTAARTGEMGTAARTGWIAAALVLVAAACKGGTATGMGETGGSPGPNGGGEPACPDGSETCSCYGNDTCDDGLTCASGLCVVLPGGAGGTEGGATAGGASGNHERGGAITGGRDAASGGRGGLAATGGGAADGTSGGGATGGAALGGAGEAISGGIGGLSSSGGTGGLSSLGGIGGLVSSGGMGGTAGERVLYDFADDDGGVAILDYAGDEVDGVQYVNVGNADDREIWMGLDPDTSAPRAAWSNSDGFDGSSGLLEVHAPFNGFNQSVDLEWHPDAPIDLSGQILMARVLVADGFVTGTGAVGGSYLFAKSGVDWLYAYGHWQNILQDDYGSWIELEFELDSPNYAMDGFDPTQIRAIGVQISTGAGEGDTLPSSATVCIDHITLVST